MRVFTKEILLIMRNNCLFRIVAAVGCCCCFRFLLLLLLLLFFFSFVKCNVCMRMLLLLLLLLYIQYLTAFVCLLVKFLCLSVLSLNKRSRFKSDAILFGFVWKMCQNIRKTKLENGKTMYCTASMTLFSFLWMIRSWREIYGYIEEWSTLINDEGVFLRLFIHSTIKYLPSAVIIFKKVLLIIRICWFHSILSTLVLFYRLFWRILHLDFASTSIENQLGLLVDKSICWWLLEYHVLNPNLSKKKKKCLSMHKTNYLLDGYVNNQYCRKWG